MLVLTHPETLEEQECRVVFLGEMGIADSVWAWNFLPRRHDFWGLEFTEPPSSRLSGLAMPDVALPSELRAVSFSKANSTLATTTRSQQWRRKLVA